MAMSRLAGGRWLTTLSAISIDPLDTLSSPATILSSVDLPQPDGPTSTTNFPSAMSTLTSCSTGTAPNDFDTLRIATCAIVLASLPYFPPVRLRLMNTRFQVHH